MTTDNRTNEQIVAEALTDMPRASYATDKAGLVVDRLRAANRLALPPGEDAVERAAKAYWLASEHEIHDSVTWEWDKEERKRYLWATRIVLQAAGTAPQAESGEPWLDAAGNEAQRCLRCGKYVFECCESFTPVQPSSTVDEGKIADVLTDHVLMEPNGGTSSWAWCECSCGFEVKREGATRDYVEKLARKHQARAIVEAIGGERR